MPGSLSGGTVSLPVHPDTKGFGQKLSAGVMGESGVISGLGKHLGGLIVGGLAVAGIGASIGSIVSKGLEEVKGNSATLAQLTAGVKSTGGAAGVTTKDMLGLAKSIEEYSGQTHGSIGAAEKLLLTFTNIKNVGPDKIFDQATKAAADMAAKFGGDAAGQSILLGKALNDPVRGITALTRVGVSFTSSQRDQIKAMQDSGNTMGAQKLILAELNKEFGGAAKAVGDSLPGQIEKSKRAFEAFSGAAVGALVPILVPAISLVTKGLNAVTPVVDKMSAAFGERLTPVIGHISDAFHDFFSGFTKGTDAIGSSQSIFAAWGAVAYEAISGLRTVFSGFVSGFTKGTDEIGSNQSVFAQWGATAFAAFDGIKKALKPVLDAYMAAFKQLWPAIQPLIPQVLALFTAFSPIQIIFKALTPVLPSLVKMLGTLATTLAGALGSALKTVLPILTKLAGIVSTELMKVVQLLIPVVVKLVGVIGPLLGTVLAAVMPIIGLVAQYIGNLLQAVLPLINPVLSLVMAFVPLLDPLIKLTTSILVPLSKMLMAILPPVMAIAIGIVSVLVPAVVLVGNIIAKVFGGIGKIIIGAFQGVVNFVKGYLNTIGSLINGIIDGINGVTGLGAAIGIHIGKIPHLPKLENGGTVVQPGSVLVGEKGPEVLNLPRAASVVPLNNGQSSKAASSIPESVTLVDADGSILARTHVIAGRVARQSLNAALRGA